LLVNRGPTGKNDTLERQGAQVEPASPIFPNSQSGLDFGRRGHCIAGRRPGQTALPLA